MIVRTYCVATTKKEEINDAGGEDAEVENAVSGGRKAD